MIHARFLPAIRERARDITPPRWLSGLWAMLRRPRLLALDDFLARCAIRGRHYAGLRPVPLAQIRGSVNRATDYDAEFHPLRDHDRDRWRRIDRARQRGEALPPVELIQVNAIYFIVDGHHRISVARARGQTEVDASVTVWQTANCACLGLRPLPAP